MTDIRPITHSEAATFLKLLCDAFELDESRASSVFYTEPFYELDRKWALFENGVMHSILTLTPLSFGWGAAVGIAGVATLRSQQGRGLAGELLRETIAASEATGEGAMLLFARATTLYERLGFEPTDEVIRGEIRSTLPPEFGPTLSTPEVRKRYDAWAAAGQGRLRRDERRWNYWTWNMRSCEGYGSGYVCHEGALVREAVIKCGHSEWPVAPGTDWLGLRGMSRALGVPLQGERSELILMARELPMPVEMFMTDQF